MSNDVPDHIKPYLDEIADRLWSNNAVVMVGAGFSRNANPVTSASASFPSWQELGDIFYRKLNGRLPKDEARYMSLLKLAEQIEAAFGRPALDGLLRQSIPNLDYEPSPLHSQLLNLPWKDVFTTNYDTLLERARAFVTLKHYDIVTTDEDLLYASQPRIVKLHGSFPSPPFVITEEDYRRYPSDHAPFVNTVRQSLLENTLCLIGFSGDDPNFLQWIGWVRDHIGKESAPKIYLIGVFDALSEAERNLLNGRSIVIVDLSRFSIDHREATGAFLDYLKNRKPRAGDWPQVSVDAKSWAMQANPERYLEIVTEWRRQREEYPGWVVMSNNQRKLLWFYTSDWLSHLSHISPTGHASLEAPLDLDLAYELGWRLERCMYPLTKELAAFLDNVATKYGNETLPLLEETDWTRVSVSEAVADIRLWLLRHYREEGLVEKWQKVKQAFADDFKGLLPEQKARLLFEGVLNALFRFDPAEAKRLLTNWQSNETLPLWEAKRAALMAELGEVTAAHSILESSLLAIRKQLGLKPVIEDYTLVSQESVVMLLLWAVEQSVTVKERNPEAINLLDELSERQNDLARYGCDPRYEIVSLSERLRHRPEGRGQFSKSHRFDLGKVTNTFHFGPDEEVVEAHGLLRMHEEVGLPYRIEHTTFIREPVESLLFRVRSHSPYWALVTLVRLGDARTTDGLFDREFLSSLTIAEVDGFFEVYMPAFERTVGMANEPEWMDAKPFDLLAKTLPEVFSRLCYKCSPKYRKLLLVALRAIYGSKHRRIFDKVRVFSERLFDSMSVEERSHAVSILVDFPIQDCQNEIEKQDFINPLLLLNQLNSVQRDMLSISPAKVDELLLQFSESTQHRDWMATTLVWLHDRSQLNEQQSRYLGKLLWDGIEAPEFPIVNGFFCFVCMNLPKPNVVDPEPRVKERLRAMIGEGSENDYLDNTLVELISSAGTIKWSETDVMEFVDQLSGWWGKRKHLLQQQTPKLFGSPADKTKKTVWKAVSALSRVFSHIHLESDENEKFDSLRAFLADLVAHDIPTRRLEAATWRILSINQEQVTEKVATAMLDKDHDVVVDALNAADILLCVPAVEEMHHDFESVVNMLVQGVQWRHRPALRDRLKAVEYLVKDYPRFLSMETLNSLLLGLREIAGETSKPIKGNDQDGLISIRAAAASLAFSLFEYYQRSGSDEPEPIRRWREVCSDPNEFAEVKNSWLISG